MGCKHKKYGDKIHNKLELIIKLGNPKSPHFTRDTWFWWTNLAPHFLDTYPDYDFSTTYWSDGTLYMILQSLWYNEKRIAKREITLVPYFTTFQKKDIFIMIDKSQFVDMSTGWHMEHLDVLVRCFHKWRAWGRNEIIEKVEEDAEKMQKFIQDLRGEK